MASPGPVKVLDALKGTSFVAIEAAAMVLPQRSLQERGSTIAVLLDGEQTVVVVAGAQERVGARVEPPASLTAPELDRLASAPDRVEVQDTIQSDSLPAIAAAVEVFLNRKLELQAYRITLLSEGSSRVVAFADKDTRPGGRGSAGGRPGFEVEMSSRDLAVRRSNFVR
jgi:hypothetical protein